MVLSVGKELLEKDMSGKVVIVTGANSGIGKTCTEQLVKQGATVVLAVRRVESGQKVADGLQGEKGACDVMKLDNSSLQSVREFVEEFRKKYDKLHILYLNAGIMNHPKATSKDGFELQFAVNHLAHFLLTELLLDILEASAPSRVVIVSSCISDKVGGAPKGDKVAHIWFDDGFLNPSGTKKYNGWTAYGQAKLANLLHAKELAKRMEGKGVYAVSLHPGFVQSNLIRHSVPGWIRPVLVYIFKKLNGMISPWDGAQTSLFCLLDDSIETPQANGKFYAQEYSPRNQFTDKANDKGGWPMEKSPNPEGDNEDVAKRLYEESLKMVGLQGSSSSQVNFAETKENTEVQQG